MYIKNGTLIVLESGLVKLAHKVSQVGGKQAPFKLHFAAAPGRKPVQDTVVEVADIVTTTGVGTHDLPHDHGVWYDQEEPPHGPNNPTYEPTTTSCPPRGLRRASSSRD